MEFIKLDLSLESFYQTILQLVLVFLSRTETPTTGGLNVLFEMKLWNMPIDFLLTISVFMSLRTCISLHLKVIETEKGLFPIISKIFAFLSALMANARRVLSLIVFFVPSMGLFNLLFHWKAEQLPFTLRRIKASDNLIKASDTLELYDLKEQVLWSEVDNWNYEDPLNPKAPDYTFYTGLNLKETFVAFSCLMGLHVLLLFIIKYITVEDFHKGSFFKQVIHILEVMNIASPWQDWDSEKCSVEEFKRKHKNVNKEMNHNILTNFIFSLLMTTPLIYTGKSEN